MIAVFAFNDEVKKFYIEETPIILEDRAFMELIKLKLYDQSSFNHSIKVCRIVSVVARLIGLKVAEATIGALFHDIGKLYVGGSILNKKDKLTAREMQIVKNHPKWGAILAQHVGYHDPCVVKIVSEHHERIDGHGYPHGLKTPSFEAQVVAMIDALDALTHNRPYRKKYNHKKAKEKILSGDCGEFDPSLAKEVLLATEEGCL